jgi:hypothetical protein
LYLPSCEQTAFSPTPNTQECFRLHLLFWRIIPDDMSIPSPAILVDRGGAMYTFTPSLNFAFTEF